MTINGVLNFATTNRYLSIGSNQLNFGVSSSITGAGSSAFIKTNGVSSDLGVVKTWPVGTTTFTYPVGTLTNYTPVRYTLTVSSSGTLTIIPVNSRHVTYNVASSEQILNYYWIVNRGNTLTYTSTGAQQYSFPSTLMGGSGGSLVAGYLDLSNPVGWITSGHGGSATTTSMTFTNQLNTNLPALDNTYHFSVGTVNTLPNPIVPVYSRLSDSNVSNSSTGGNWNSPSSWTTSPSGIGPALSSAPYGVPVVVLNGARINLNVNARIAFTSKVDGLLVVGTTTAHNLGNISGTGTIRVNTNTFPAGNYTAFVSAAGGTIEYVGPMTMNNRSVYNNISIIGTGNVTMTNTDLTLNGSLTIASGATLNNTTNNRNITIARNITNNGTFNIGTGTVTFNGSLSSAISGSTTFTNLVISKTSNDVTLSGSATTTVNNTLTLTSGNIITSSSHLLVLSSSSVISGGGSGSFISGPVRRPLSSGGSFTFPLGSVTASRYRPVRIESTSVADTWTVEYIGRNPSSDGYSNIAFNLANLRKISAFEYWNITRTGSASANVTLTYDVGSYIPPNVGNVANLRVAHWDGTQWDLPTGGGSASQTGSITAGTVTVTNVTSFSPFTLGSLDSDSPLPVRWLSFTGAWKGNSIELIWRTAEEVNNERFEIERSVNGIDFHKIGWVPSNAAAASPRIYTFNDNEVSTYVKYYYRIRQVDFDGQSEYSKVIAILPVGEPTQRWVAYPNPVNNTEYFTLKETDPVLNSDEVVITLYSMNGAIVFKTTGSIEKINGNLSAQLNRLSAGLYVLEVSAGIHRENFRIIRQ
jgi:fibronectin-binding autotransporter adhesin